MLRVLFFFFFKQKTAYEMRISDWSSDVCSSDLAGAADVETDRSIEFERVAAGRGFGVAVHQADFHAQLVDEDHHAARAADRAGEIGRASCRERVCQYV